MQEEGDEPVADSQRMLQEAVAALDQAASNMLAQELEPYRFEDWSQPGGSTSQGDGERSDCGLGQDKTAEKKSQREPLRDELRIEIGRRQIAPSDLYELGNEGMLLLDSARQDLADLYVGLDRFAKGEVLCLDGRIGFRVIQIIDPLGSQQ